ncbi:MAG: SLC13 family permease [Candidatus Micrarchaeota archaeon]|nr:SLC13 family permease [Candidatus Micrarchaeota archaeon]
MANIVSIVILAVVLASILLRDFLRLKIAPWHAMAAGGIAAVLLGAITPQQALKAIDLEVMAFLYGMFLLAYFLQKSWYLEHLGYKVLHRFSSPFVIFCAIVFSAGFASAFLLNDTIAIIGVPLCIMMARRSGISAKPLLLALALAVTIGSMATPLGNPQNFIIARRMEAGAFAEFLYYLGLPAAASLFFLACILWVAFPQLKRLRKFETDVKVRTPTYSAARAGFRLVLALSLLRLANEVASFIPDFPFWAIAVAGGASAVLLSREWKALLKVDFETLAFFAGMFVLMDAVWLSGFFQQFLPESRQLLDPATIVGSSLILSQLLSNVPFVILYLKAAGENIGSVGLILLAAGSTLAGGIAIIGAASNIIILQGAEKSGERFPVLEFSIYGIAVVAISLLLLGIWLKLLNAA